MVGHTKEPWAVGQHPAMSSGWIVRPVLFGSSVTVLPEHEGGHVALKREADAHLIAAAPDLLEASRLALNALVIASRQLTEDHKMVLKGEGWAARDIASLRAAIAKANGEAAQ